MPDEQLDALIQHLQNHQARLAQELALTRDLEERLTERIAPKKRPAQQPAATTKRSPAKRSAKRSAARKTRRGKKDKAAANASVSKAVHDAILGALPPFGETATLNDLIASVPFAQSTVSRALAQLDQEGLAARGPRENGRTGWGRTEHAQTLAEALSPAAQPQPALAGTGS